MRKEGVDIRGWCVCGGWIVPSRLRPDDIEGAVQLHNMSLAHVAWRYRREGPTASVVIRDVSGCSPRASDSPGRFS